MTLTFKEAAEKIRQEMEHNMAIYGQSAGGKVGYCNVCKNVNGIAYRKISIVDGTIYQECVSCFWYRRMSELKPMTNEKAERVENIRKYFNDRRKRTPCAIG